MTLANTINVAPPQTHVTSLTSKSEPASIGGMSFGDILDTVNPLQHVPVLSNIYRSVTGSSISTASKVAGDTLYGFALGGGMISAIAGAASSTADVVLSNISGSDVGSHIVNAVSSSDKQEAFQLVPNTPGTVITPPIDHASVTAPIGLPLDKNLAVVTGQYQQAQIQGGIYQKLLAM